MKRPLTAVHAACLAACLVVTAGAEAPVSVSAAALPTTIPFELAMRHIIVKVSVNKSKPLSFIFDTGDDVAIIRMDPAKELGLKLEGSVRTGGAGPGTQNGQLVKNATWSLVGLESFKQPVAFALPMPELPAGLGREIDGIIGGQFIHEFVVELDYQTRTLTLHDPGSFKYAGKGESLPLEFANGHPIVRATVTPIGGQPLERRFMFDVGSSGALILHSPFAAEQNLPGPGTKTIRSIGGSGAGGRTVGRIGRVASLRLGSFELTQPFTMFSEDKAGAFANAAVAGNIGAQVANRFRVFLDYQHQRMILEPAPGFAAPYERAFSGLALRADADLKTLRVLDVLEDSAATDAGIEPGDILAAVNGKAAGDLTLAVINEMFEKPLPYEVTLQRGTRTITTSLTPRKMV